MFFYVYVLKSKKTGKIYTGFTNNLVRRIKEHQKGLSEYTRNNGPYELIYFEGYKNRDEAYHREQNLKLRANALTGLKRRIVKSLSEAQ